MPRLTTQQTNFTAGEITPRIHGRTDIDRYANAAKEMTNCHPVIHGGSKRRAGTRFAKSSKLGGASASRLIDFIVSRDVAYILEFGDLYVRVFSPNGVYTGIELVSPYSAAQVAAIDYTQGADTMFLFHGSVPIQRLRSFTPTVWDLSAAPFTVQPFDEVGYRPATALTLGATTGAGVTATAGAAVFLLSDVGRNIISAAGVGQIVGYTSSTVVTINITTAFATLVQASGAWYMDVSPQSFLTAGAKGPSGAAVTLNASLTRAATLSLSALTGAITVTASAGVFSAGDVGKVIYADSGVLTISTYTSPTQVSGTTTTTFASASYVTGAWGVTGDAFRTVDVGKYVRMNDGLALITAVVSTTTATATVLTEFSSIVTTPPLAWTLEDKVWSATFGYPSTGTLFQQRLWCANSTKYPQTVWGSVTGQYLDFQKGTKDTDACIFTIASDTINPISFLASQTDLIVHTYGGEFIMTGGTDTAITPTNIEIKPQTYHGSKGVRPLTIGKESVFVQRAGRKVRAMSYVLQVDGYVAPDLTALAEHITAGGIVAMAYQQEPDTIIWAVLADGTLISCTIDRDQAVTGWAKHYTQGAFESVCVIPNGAKDQVWVIVRRTINGATARYVEWLDDDFAPILPGTVDPLAFPPVAAPVVYGTTADAAIVNDNVLGVTTVGGLSHLEGCTVDAVGDGSVLGTFTVSGGIIALPRKSFRTLVGLHFQSKTVLLTPEVGTGSGTAQGNNMRTSEITMRFLNTVGASVIDGDGQAQEVPWRSFGPAVLNQPPPVYTGLVRIEMLGWERGRAEISVVQDHPLPMHLLSVIRKFTVND
jgi:hypothetical protein